MMHKREHFIISALITIIIVSTLNGCSSFGPPHVKQGDTAIVNYTCRLSNGEVVLTTREEIAGDKASHAAIFLPFKKYGPENLVAGGSDNYPKFGKLKMFEWEAAVQVSQAIVGMKVGENYTIVLKSDIPSDLKEEDRYTTLGRVARKEKEQKVVLKVLKEKLGHVPAIGEQAFSYRGFVGTVKGIIDKEALIHIEVEDGRIVDQPFGKGVIRDYPDHYDIVTTAQEGQLVRTASQVGRIIKVTETTFTIDYGHPFGGEELMCDVRIDSILPRGTGAGEIPQKDKQP
jgi:FKBP-type peptidyl-prolyl cis-trans isomerase 2